MLNNRTSNLWGIWGVAFIYTCLVSALVQLILLPYFFPRWHAGGGLFIGCPDSAVLHQVAVEMAEKIRLAGWGEWRLRPNNQSPAGIAAFIYALTWSRLWVLIPLNAALHASAFLIIFQLINLFMKNQIKSLLCVLPFLVFPSNLQWTAQLHKDGFGILGSVLILYSIIILVGLNNLEGKDWRLFILRSFIFCLAGIFLIWLGRPYLLMIIKFIMILIFPLIIGVFLRRGFHGVLPWQKVLFALGVFFINFFALSRGSLRYMETDPEKFSAVMSRSDQLLELSAASNLQVNQLKAAVEAKPETLPPASVKEEAKRQEIVKAAVEAKPETLSPASVEEEVQSPAPPAIEVVPQTVTPQYVLEETWKNSWGLPLFIEKKAYSLAQIRGGYRFTSPTAGSNIDTDVGFNSIKSIFAYLPRAGQIVFLAPFPGQWLSNQGSYIASPLMRRISALEMLVIYFGLFFLSYSIWYWRKRIEIWLISIFCISIMLVFGLVVCNIGTLHRMRYVYITTLVALGIAGFFAFLTPREAEKSG